METGGQAGWARVATRKPVFLAVTMYGSLVLRFEGKKVAGDRVDARASTCVHCTRPLVHGCMYNMHLTKTRASKHSLELIDTRRAVNA